MITEPSPATCVLTAKIDWTEDPVMNKIIFHHFLPIDIINQALRGSTLRIPENAGYYKTGFVLRAEFSDARVWEHHGRIDIGNSTRGSFAVIQDHIIAWNEWCLRPETPEQWKLGDTAAKEAKDWIDCLRVN